MATPRVYLDACCLHRPLDDQRQERVRLEAGATLMLLGLATTGTLHWVSSTALYEEISRNPSEGPRLIVQRVLRHAYEVADVGSSARIRAREFVQAGLMPFDALHLAIAEDARCEVLLTTDDRFRQRARMLSLRGTSVENPLAWLVQYLHL